LILVTNDDGIAAPGIRSLVKVAAKFGEVLVVAPDSPQSGQGHAITINEPLRLRKVNIFDNIEAYECSGTPADCVKLARNIVDKNNKIKLCISGINHGSNASINILYSGTMSAAMEACLEGIPSIGFSLCDYSFDADFGASEVIATKIISDILGQDTLPPKLLLNVNIPKGNYNDIKGIKVCRQGRGGWQEEYKIGTDPRGENYYWLAGKFETHEDLSDTTIDVGALENGYVSVVPSYFDLTRYELIKSIGFLEL
jgi:5'-nucleotidase